MAAIENFILKIKVQGQAAVDGLRKSVNGLSSDLQSMASVGGPLSNSISGIVGKLGPLSLAASAAGVAFVSLGLKAIALADDMADISDATGISAGALNNFRNSLVLAGGKAEDFSTLAAKLNQNLGDAAVGGEKSQKAFQKLGVFVTDANGAVRDTGDVLRDAIAKLAAIENPAVRAALAVDIFGKNAAKLDFTKLNAANDPFKDAQIAQLAKYQDAIDKMALSIENNLITAFGELFLLMESGFSAQRLDGYLARFLSMVNGMSSAEILEIQRKNRVFLGLEKDLKPGQRPLSPGTIPSTAGAGRGGQGGPTAAQLAAASGPGGGFGATPEATLKAIADSEKRLRQSVVNSNKNIALGGANEIQAIEINAAAEIARAREEIFNQERLTDAQKSAEFAAKKKEIETKAVVDTANLRSQINARIFSEEEAQRQKFNEELAAEEKRINDIVTASSRVVDEIILQNAELATQALFAKSIANMTDQERINAQALFDIEQERLKLLKQIADIKDLPFAERLAKEKAVNDLLNQRKTDAVENQQEQKRLSQDFSMGWGKAYRQYVEDASNTSKAGYDLFATATRGMEDSIVNFAKTGKFEFKSLVSTIVEELIRSQIRQLFASTFGGNLFGGGGGGSLFPALLGLPGYANGGMIPTNAPVIVGERGPEILTGAAGRTVIPNNALGGSTNITYNINAVDASSFRSLVASDPEFIFAVTEQGRRRMPSQRR
jgi:lambda family phage tail tape measure protein